MDYDPTEFDRGPDMGKWLAMAIGLSLLYAWILFY